jgi:hypothetical protein
MHRTSIPSRTLGNLKSQELANLCSNTIDQVADIAEGGLDRIVSDAALAWPSSVTPACACEPPLRRQLPKRL